MAANINRSFKEFGWCTSIRGVGKVWQGRFSTAPPDSTPRMEVHQPNSLNERLMFAAIAYAELVMPRFLSRLPYGIRTNPVDSFDFEEQTDGADHNNYAWATL
jgi:predicted component of type VI protein secretion system